MRKLIAILMLLCALTGAAAADDFGQSYDLFQSLYAENVSFINQNTGRHLLPHSLTATFDAEGQRIYVIASGALYAEIYLDDLSSQIASCRITLTAPAGMQYGDSQHNDFTISGYHSYALLMAMHDSQDPVARYALVEEVNAGLASGSGQYSTQVGDYRLTCQSADGVAAMLFENDLLLGKPIEEPAGEGDEEGVPSIEIKE